MDLETSQNSEEDRSCNFNLYEEEFFKEKIEFLSKF